MIKKFTAKYPSNIALVKYWGKHGNQLPCNASLSMTLNKAFTETTLQLFDKKSNEVELEYYFEGNANSNFQDRIVKYLGEQSEFTSILKDYSIRIDSKNSFPHSTGIASSASAFATIAALFLKASDSSIGEATFNKNASRLARLGSGSASRSFYGPYALWGQLDGLENSNNEFAIPVVKIHDNFQSMRDAILIVEDEPKKVSSSVGHSLMKNHPYAKARFIDANKHCNEMLLTLESGDFDTFISITEREALSLHSMMMTSENYYLLMKPETIRIIEQIFIFREETKLPICFTLDAGPNLHLLYPDYIKEKVHTFVDDKLKGGLKSILYDRAGVGGEIFKL